MSNPPSNVRKLRARKSGTRTSIPPTRPRVLFVDDDELIAKAFRRSMRRYGIDVIAVSSGAEALRVSASGGFDVLVTDLSMPEMDGVALITALDERGSTMSYVVATGYGELCARGAHQLRHLHVHVVGKPWNDAAVAELLFGLAATAAPAAQAC